MADELLKGSNRMDVVELTERKQRHGWVRFYQIALGKGGLLILCVDATFKTCRDNMIDWGLDEEVVKLAFKPIRWVCH